MTHDRKHLALKALSTALRIRRDTGVHPISPISIYDFVERNGVEVRFCSLPSLEGMYSARPGPLIILSSERPSGRQAFTCAHEFGHHIFKHDMSVDEKGVGLYSDENDEFLVDCFAGFLLMPKIAISNAFVRRGWDLRRPTPFEILAIASYFGVGYSTLIHHMRSGLRILDGGSVETLLETTLKEVRNQAIGDSSGDFVVVDQQWVGRPVDLRVGDHVLSPLQTMAEGHCVEPRQDLPKGRVFRATQPGMGRLFIEDGVQWSVFVRVSRQDYVGRSRYRFLEEVE